MKTTEIRFLGELAQVETGQVVLDARGEWFQRTRGGLFKKFGIQSSFRHDDPHLPARVLHPDDESDPTMREIKLTEDECRNVAESLAPEYGSIVSTGEIVTRIHEIHDDKFDGDDEPHQDTIDRIELLVRHARVTVTFPDHL